MALFGLGGIGWISTWIWQGDDGLLYELLLTESTCRQIGSNGRSLAGEQ